MKQYCYYLWSSVFHLEKLFSSISKNQLVHDFMFSNSIIKIRRVVPCFFKVEEKIHVVQSLWSQFMPRNN